MNRFLRLLCLATLATAAFAQSSAGTSDPTLAAQGDSRRTKPSAAHPASTSPEAAMAAPTTSGQQEELQLRSTLEHSVLPAATVLRLKLDRAISTASARPGQPFTATLTRPVEVDGRAMIPAGTSVSCQVEHARGARRFAGKPSLSVKALGVRMPNGEQLSFTASVVDTANPRTLNVDEEGRIHGASANPLNKVEMGSLAGAGAVAGAVIAGPEGLLFGVASGAVVAAGHIVVKYRDLNLPAGTELIFELDSAATSASRPLRSGM